MKLRGSAIDVRLQLEFVQTYAFTVRGGGGYRCYKTGQVRRARQNLHCAACVYNCGAGALVKGVIIAE